MFEKKYIDNRLLPFILGEFKQKKILNLIRIFLFQTGVPGEIRTPDPRLRRALLYPAELLRRFVQMNK